MTIRRFIEDGVDTSEALIDGEMIQWDKGLSYARHLQTDQLLGAQVPVSDKPDELLFIIMHQTMELWLKLVIHEARIAMEAISADRLEKAGKALDRIATVERHMIHSWEVLATLTPHDFLTFRGYLRKASGFQSHQYRELEYCLGDKRQELILVHSDTPAVAARLQSALEAPSLYDEVLRLLGRRGFSIPAYLERDWSAAYVADSRIEDAWLAIYTNPEAQWELYQLGEQLTALEYYFQEWRFKHMKTVSRVIGHKKGTGGSAGVNYLAKALDRSFFPELWTMRTRMTAPKQGKDYGADA
jgi:tryptophan 2,3-dioxygenase